MRAYLHALSDVHAPKPWLSVQSGPRAESLSVVPATSAWWAQRTAPSPATAKTAGRGGLDEDCEMVALKRTSSRCPIPTPLHRPSLHYLSKGLMGSDDLWKDAEQLQLLVRRVEVEQRDDEDDRRTRPPTILREQQRSTGTTCVEVGGRTLLRLKKPCVGSAATRNHPKTAR